MMCKPGLTGLHGSYAPDFALHLTEMERFFLNIVSLLDLNSVYCTLLYIGTVRKRSGIYLRGNNVLNFFLRFPRM